MSIPAYACPLDIELAALLFGNHASFMVSRDCRNFHCYSFDTGYVYGLLDTRINDIFYVGSTVQTPGKRYSAHMGGRQLSNFREAWILSILADGSIPIFLSLGEFKTPCVLELQAREKDTALALRAMGHTALSDDDRSGLLAHRFPACCASRQK
jgi:hypothetical protein